MDAFLQGLGDEIEDADEGLLSPNLPLIHPSNEVSAETFYLFSQSHSSRDLGMVDGKAAELEITIGDRDFTIKQSPGVLQSKRQGGTTGAAVWECSVRFAQWLGSSTNPLFTQRMLDKESHVLELGAGISGLVPLMLVPRVKEVVATDQQYALNILRENVQANTATNTKPRHSKTDSANIAVLSLDWEANDFASTLRSHGQREAFDAVVACDCVFNYALIEPFVQACAEACRFGRDDEDRCTTAKPAICLVAQQLRQPDVFQQWLEAFLQAFRVWRIPDNGLTDRLKEGGGFAVHIGMLR